MSNCVVMLLNCVEFTYQMSKRSPYQVPSRTTITPLLARAILYITWGHQRISDTEYYLVVRYTLAMQKRATHLNLQWHWGLNSNCPVRKVLMFHSSYCVSWECQVHTIFLSEFSRQCYLDLPLSNCSILSFSLSSDSICLSVWRTKSVVSARGPALRAWYQIQSQRRRFLCFRREQGPRKRRELPFSPRSRMCLGEFRKMCVSFELLRCLP